MTTAFDGLQRASFGTVEFAWTSRSITSEFRKYDHAYRRTPGSRLEKHGRNIYVIRFESIFDEALNRETLANGSPGYPGNYPDALNTLRGFYEQGLSQDLTIPGLGTLVAMMTKWDQRADLPTRSGERAVLEFAEDMEEEFQLQAIVSPSSAASLEGANEFLQREYDKLNIENNLFDDIQNAVDQLLAIRDQVGLAGELIAGKAFAIAAICDEIDKTMKQLQDPLNNAVLNALKQLWFSAQRIGVDARSALSSPIRTYVAPTTITIQQASQAIFGVTSRSSDLLQLNSFPDMLRIPAGTRIRFFDETA